MFLYGCRQYFFAVKIDANTHGNLIDAEPALSIDHGCWHKPQESSSLKNLLRHIMAIRIIRYIQGPVV